MYEMYSYSHKCMVIRQDLGHHVEVKMEEVEQHSGDHAADVMRLTSSRVVSVVAIGS